MVYVGHALKKAAASRTARALVDDTRPCCTRAVKQGEKELNRARPARLEMEFVDDNASVCHVHFIKPFDIELIKRFLGLF